MHTFFSSQNIERHLNFDFLIMRFSLLLLQYFDFVSTLVFCLFIAEAVMTIHVLPVRLQNEMSKRS